MTSSHCEQHWLSVNYSLSASKLPIKVWEKGAIIIEYTVKPDSSDSYKRVIGEGGWSSGGVNRRLEDASGIDESKRIWLVLQLGRP